MIPYSEDIGLIKRALEVLEDSGDFPFLYDSKIDKIANDIVDNVCYLFIHTNGLLVYYTSLNNKSMLKVEKGSKEILLLPNFFTNYKDEGYLVEDLPSPMDLILHWYIDASKASVKSIYESDHITLEYENGMSYNVKQFLVDDGKTLLLGQTFNETVEEEVILLEGEEAGMFNGVVDTIRDEL